MKANATLIGSPDGPERVEIVDVQPAYTMIFVKAGHVEIPAGNGMLVLPDGHAHWRRTGEVFKGGDTGGDMQAGEAWTVVYVHDGQPRSMVTEYFYAAVGINDVDHDGPFHVTGQVEYLTCTDITDPGGTETWADYTYTDLPGTYSTLEAADVAARARADRSRAIDIPWDGITSQRPHELKG